MAKEDDKLDETQQEAKEAKKESKKDDSKEESAGSKLVSALIVLVIILIWLGIFVLAVKLDVGGFGSKVLAPVLKDVPVVNRILPDTSNAGDSQYDYATVEEAVAKIKELQMELDSKNSSSGVDSNYIAELEAEVQRLKKFEAQQNKFAKEKKEFDENVVYADHAPSLDEYKKYYEEMNPDNAAEIYRQVVQELQASQRVQDAADRYSNMDPASAAQVLDQMTSADLDMVCDILAAMKADQSALILQELDSNVAAKITKRMLARN